MRHSCGHWWSVGCGWSPASSASSTGPRGCAKPFRRCSGPRPSSSGVSGTSARTWCAISRRVSRRPGVGDCNRPTSASTYAEARTALGQLRQELRGLNGSAVASLDEGLEKTLTLHRRGLFPTLRGSLKTTNCLESLNAQLGQLTDKVDHWHSSNQKHRWVASALLLIEPRLRRIKGYRHLPRWRAALQTEIGRTEKSKGVAVA